MGIEREEDTLLRADIPIYRARQAEGYSMLNYRPAMTDLILADILKQLRATPILELEQLAKACFDKVATAELQVTWHLPLWQAVYESRN